MASPMTAVCGELRYNMGQRWGPAYLSWPQPLRLLSDLPRLLSRRS